MYNRVYSGGNVHVPPDYSGSAIKYHPAEEQPQRQTFSPPQPPKPQPPPPPQAKPQCPCGEPPDTPCDKKSGYLGNLLSKISADDLLIYGIVLYMTLQDSDSTLLLVVLLALVML